ncbi:MAG TPA: peptidase M22 [Syntrophomonadaceae bacterium]|nr:peptidase M22 [Syntrophomonadaceae bacterium]HQE23764.1 peptidase M22 [Syntrophomonadaceae bacterium]
MKVFLGIDTSAYTTSIAAVDENLSIVADERMVLKVEPGKRGLRQSEALFLHIKNLPQLMERLDPLIYSNIQALAVSTRPRNKANSYMPVFLAGTSLAQSLAAFAHLPVYQVSHQEGHVMAGLQGSWELLDKTRFLAVHFSGGTSDILMVENHVPGVMTITQLASSEDIHAGQLVDRVGVAMGLPFPAGPALEDLAGQADDNQSAAIPTAITEKGFSFSGAETRAVQMLNNGTSPETVAAAVLGVIAKTLERVLRRFVEQLEIKDVLLAGGVMANGLIAQRLKKRLQHPAVGAQLYFASPHLSTDNAVGVAMLAALQHRLDQ